MFLRLLDRNAMADFTMMAQAVLSFVVSQTRGDGDQSLQKWIKRIGKGSMVSRSTSWAPDEGLLPALLEPLHKLCKSLLDAGLNSQKYDHQLPEISIKNASSVQKSSDDNSGCIDDLAAGDNIDPAPMNRPHHPTWRVASAAVNHMTGNPGVLTAYTPITGDQTVDVANLGQMKVHGVGSVNTPNVVLQNVWYVPGLEMNLVSAGQLTKLGHKVRFGSYGCRITKGSDKNVIGKARFTDDFQFEVEFVKVN